MMQLFLETIRVSDGNICLPEMHKARMCATVEKIFHRPAQLTGFPTTVPEPFRKGKVKCRIIYDTAIREVTFTPYTPRRIDTLRLVEGHDIDYALKYADRSALEHLREMRDGCDDILIVKDGCLTDTSYSNIVLENSHGLFTPDTSLLNGIRRRHLLANGQIRETRITPAYLPSYNRLYLINALLDISDNISLPVSNILKHEKTGSFEKESDKFV